MPLNTETNNKTLHIIYFTSVILIPYHWNPPKQHNFHILSILPQWHPHFVTGIPHKQQNITYYLFYLSDTHTLSLEFYTNNKTLHIIYFTSVTLHQYHWNSTLLYTQTSQHSYIILFYLSDTHQYHWNSTLLHTHTSQHLHIILFTSVTLTLYCHWNSTLKQTQHLYIILILPQWHSPCSVTGIPRENNTTIYHPYFTSVTLTCSITGIPRANNTTIYHSYFYLSDTHLVVSLEFEAKKQILTT